MAIVYTDGQNRFFYVTERYTVDQTDWIRYTNTLGEEFACLREAFEERFILLENQE